MLICFITPSGYAQSPTHPVMFCTQVPDVSDFATLMSTFANHVPSVRQAPRGGDLYIRYPNGNLKNLTQLAGYGEAGMQGANAIAVRDPHVHWNGDKALFSMVIGAPAQQYAWETYYWQIYEITGLGENDTPVITLVPNQPNNYNNVSPMYGTDDRILFVSDCPRGEAAHLYPQHDEYESTRIVTGLWRINPNACSGNPSLEMLTHSPSGDFTPIMDSYGRIVFIRWDHLKRDQQADADIIYGNNYGTFNYSDESPNAAKTDILPDIEVFPEPRAIRTDLFALPEWQNTNSHDFNIFNPWMINEDGTELETLNHIGRHELTSYFESNFLNDANLTYFTDLDGIALRNLFHIQESPTTPGLYYGTNAPEFGTHASGMVISLYLPKGMPADSAVLTFITHPDTRFSTNTPSAQHSGLYRNPIPLENGDVLVTHSSTTEEVDNIGTFNMPISKYDFRLQLLEPDGSYYKADGNFLTGNGITKSISYYDPDNLISYNGLLWETFPVIVKPRPLPTTSTLNTPIPLIEQALFDSAGVNIHSFQNYLKRHDLALTVARNVTSRDIADRQQPFNLKISGNGTQTINPQLPDNIYEVKYMQYLQGDQLRGIGGIDSPTAGRRVIAQYMHDSTATQYNLPSTGTQGSINLESDGSVAALVPANRAMTWQLTDADNKPIVRERIWMSFVPGEIRVCTSCHGENQFNQAGLPAPTNPPLALTSLLNHLKSIDADGDNIADIEDYYPNDATKQYGEAVSETFVNQLSDWMSSNGGNDGVEWASIPGDICNDEVAVINNRLEDNTGTSDALTRIMDLSDFSTAILQFDVAYARYDNTFFDALRIKIASCDGGFTDVVYDKSGTALATVPDQTNVFNPSDCSEWRTECINLSGYAGQVVELIFENIGGWGNQLFLDNILVMEESPVTACSDASPPNIIVDNSSIGILSDPTDDVLTITGIIGSYQIQILRADGTVFQSLQGTNTLNIDISRLPAGLYFLSIIQDGNGLVRVEKILKE